jgi:cytoskeletal protein CcmA (bactofilin family)
MWKSSRKEDELNTPTPESKSTAPTVPLSYATPRAADPLRGDAPRSAELATIGKSVVVKGELSGSEDLYVDGEVEGSIALRGQTLTVGPNGRVRANVEARNVVVHGRIDGDVHATDRVDLRKTASLSGDISTSRISIEDGAFFKGTIDIQKPEPAAASVKGDARPQPFGTVGPVGTSSGAAAAPAQGSLLEPKKY